MDLKTHRQTPETLPGITYIGCWSVICRAVSARRPPEICLRVSANGVGKPGFGNLSSLDDDAPDFGRLARPVRAC